MNVCAKLIVNNVEWICININDQMVTFIYLVYKEWFRS